MVEILVITALQEEMDAVLGLMLNGRRDWNEYQIDEGYSYFETEIDNDGESFILKVTSQAQPGPTYATAHTTLMLKGKPDILFMTGICAGNQDEEIELGDIIIADMAFHYETGKLVEGGFNPEIENSNVDPVVVQWLKDYCSVNKGSLEVDGTERKLYVGAFATGSPVVSRKDIFTNLQKRDRKVLALDTEAYCVLKAVEISNLRVPAVVIKGVCDFADPDKDDRAHKVAADGAAKCMLGVAKHILPRLPDREPQSAATSVVYPISLSRPAKTYGDRLKWQALLQWPQAENWHFGWGKDLETGEYDLSSEFSGLEFFNLRRNKWLLEVTVGYGAYNGTYRYYFLDETRYQPVWQEVLFRSFYWNEVDEIREAPSPEIDGNAWFDPERNLIQTFYKARGIGDTGHLISYKFADGTATLLEYRQKLENDLDSDDVNFYTAPEEWPKLDIDRVYPKWEGDLSDV